MRLFGSDKITKKDDGCKINRFEMVDNYFGCNIRDIKECTNLVRIDTGNDKLNKKIGQFALEEIEKYYCPNHE